MGKYYALVIATIAIIFLASQVRSETCVNAVKSGIYPCDVMLQWTDNSSTELSFIIERQLNGSAFTQLATVGANITTVIDATVTRSATVDNNYCYRAAAANLDVNGKPQQSAYSNTACFLVETPAPILPPAAASNLTAK